MTPHAEKEQHEDEALTFTEESRGEQQETPLPPQWPPQQHQSEQPSPSQSQAHPIPPWSSAQMDLVVLTTAGPRAVMDGVDCQDRDTQRRERNKRRQAGGVSTAAGGTGKSGDSEETETTAGGAGAAAKGATVTANVATAMAGTAAAAATAAPEAAPTPAAADTSAAVGDLLSRRQGDGKHNPRPSLRRYSKGSHSGWYNRSAATAATTATT